MKPFLSLASAALLVSLAVPAFADDSALTTDPHEIKAGDYVLDKSHGKITWSISHLGFSTYMGQFADVEAKLKIDPQAPERTLLNATVKTASVGTLNDKLDDHLKSEQFFNADKYPTATFEATRVKVTGANTADIDGNLTIMNQTKPETLKITFNQAGTNPVDHKYRLGFSGETTIKRSEFGITQYLPVLGDDVRIELEGEFVPAAE